MYPSGQPQMEQGIFGALIGAGIGALGGALNARNQRKQNQAQLQAQFDMERNRFEAANPNFEQKAAFGRRMLGNLSPEFAQTTQNIGAGAPGSAGSFQLQRFDPGKFFGNVNAGQFGADLRNAQIGDIKRPDFKAPELPGGGFLGDLFTGFAGGLASNPSGLFGGGGGAPAAEYPTVPNFAREKYDLQF